MSEPLERILQAVHTWCWLVAIIRSDRMREAANARYYGWTAAWEQLPEVAI